MDRAAYDFAVFGKDGLNVWLVDQQGVEVADEDTGVEGTRVGLIGYVAACHQARRGGGKAGTKTNQQFPGLVTQQILSRLFWLFLIRDRPINISYNQQLNILQNMAKASLTSTNNIKLPVVI